MKKFIWGSLLALLLSALITAPALADYVLESEHPYANYTNASWTYEHPTPAEYLKVTFAAETETEKPFDKISITDGAGQQTEYSGTALSGREVCLQGNSFTVRLTSNGFLNAWGFAIESVEAISEEEYDSLLPWTFKEGVLTIRSRYPMEDYRTGEQPWYQFRSSIVSVVIESGTTRIGAHAFSMCSNLKSVSIPASVTSIGDDAFQECSSLTNISIPGSVTSIGLGAFGNCSSLANVSIPSSVTSIGNSAFSGCSSLQSITIPDSVASIGDFVFINCPVLCEINVASGNSVFSSLDGVLFNKDRTILITCPEGRSGDYIIPDSVVKIGNYAFMGCGQLTGVTIPANVNDIGTNAFDNCTGLTNITLPNGVPSIKGYAFLNCRSLSRITIPASVTAVENYAFYNCSNLTSVRYLGEKAQWDAITVYSENAPLLSADLTCTDGFFPFGPQSGSCGEHVAWALADGVLSITGTGDMEWEGSAPWADYYARILYVQIENGVTSIRENAFNGCANLTSLTIPNTVTSIGYYAFSNCANLTSVTLPASVTSIDSFAFSHCPKLSSIKVPAGTATKVHTFYDADLYGENEIVYRITLPAALTEMSDGIFYDCAFPTIRPSFITPASLQTVEGEAFRGVDASFVWLSEEAASIQSGAFADCANLTLVRIPFSCEDIANDAFPAGTTLLFVGENEASEQFESDPRYTVVYCCYGDGGNG